MKNYIVHDEQGNILRSGTCVDTDFNLQGEFVIEGICRDDENYKVVDGQLVHTPKQDSPEEVQQKIRKKRNAMLKVCDFTQMPDYPAANKAAWATYRQELRDLPSHYQNETDFANVVFPTPPI
mgnify:CR=1 FL=1